MYYNNYSESILTQIKQSLCYELVKALIIIFLLTQKLIIIQNLNIFRFFMMTMCFFLH